MSAEKKDCGKEEKPKNKKRRFGQNTPIRREEPGKSGVLRRKVVLDGVGDFFLKAGNGLL